MKVKNYRKIVFSILFILLICVLAQSFVLNENILANTNNMQVITNEFNGDTIKLEFENGLYESATIDVNVISEDNYSTYVDFIEENDNIEKIFKIQLLSNQNSIELEKEAKLYLPIPTELYFRNFKIINVHNGQAQEVDFSYENYNAIITIDNLSEFIFVSEKMELNELLIVVGVIAILEFIILGVQSSKKKVLKKSLMAMFPLPLVISTQNQILIIFGLTCLCGFALLLNISTFLSNKKLKRLRKKKLKAQKEDLKTQENEEKDKNNIINNIEEENQLDNIEELENKIICEDIQEELIEEVEEEIAQDSMEEEIKEELVQEILEDDENLLHNEEIEQIAEEELITEENYNEDIIQQKSQDESESDDENEEEESDVRTIQTAKGIVIVKYSRSFESKIIQARQEVQQWYQTLKNELLSIKKAKSRLSWPNDTIRVGRETIAKFAIRGKTLVLYLNLNPENYQDTKYRIENVSEVKKYASVPSKLKITSDRQVKHAIELTNAMIEEKNLQKQENPEFNFLRDYQPDEELIEEGLIKVLYDGDEEGKEIVKEDIASLFNARTVTFKISIVESDDDDDEDYFEDEEEILQTEEIIEEPLEENKKVNSQEDREEIEEIEELEEDEDESEEESQDIQTIETEEGIKIIRYNRSFEARLIQIREDVQVWYEKLKNELLSIKKAKSRLSWPNDTIRVGRDAIAKFGIRGKTLLLFINVDPQKYENSKYRIKDVSNVKKYQDVPSKLKITSERQMRYAIELINEMIKDLELIKGEIPNEKYVREFVSDEELINMELIKITEEMKPTFNFKQD